MSLACAENYLSSDFIWRSALLKLPPSPPFLFLRLRERRMNISILAVITCHPNGLARFIKNRNLQVQRKMPWWVILQFWTYVRWRGRCCTRSSYVARMTTALMWEKIFCTSWQGRIASERCLKTSRTNRPFYSYPKYFRFGRCFSPVSASLACSWLECGQVCILSNFFLSSWWSCRNRLYTRGSGGEVAPEGAGHLPHQTTPGQLLRQGRQHFYLESSPFVPGVGGVSPDTGRSG